MVKYLRMLKENNSEEGFTLIELMIVVVIIGILAAIAIPIFMNQQKAAIIAGVKSDVKNTATNVATALVKYPTASGVVGDSTVSLRGTIKIGGTNPNDGAAVAEFDLVQSDPKTQVAAYGDWKTWQTYALYSDFGGISEFYVMYQSATGKLTVGGTNS